MSLLPALTPACCCPGHDLHLVTTFNIIPLAVVLYLWFESLWPHPLGPLPLVQQLADPDWEAALEQGKAAGCQHYSVQHKVSQVSPVYGLGWWVHGTRACIRTPQWLSP